MAGYFLKKATVVELPWFRVGFGLVQARTLGPWLLYTRSDQLAGTLCGRNCALGAG